MKIKYKRIFSKPIIISVIAFIFGHVFMEILNISMIWHLVYLIAFIGLFAKTTSSHNSVFVFRVIVPLVIGLGMVCLYRYFYTIPEVELFLSASKTNLFHLERLFESLSTLYAICVAFLLWKGLTDHDNLRLVLKEEAGQMQSILGFLNYLEGKNNVEISNRIRKNFNKYISRIVKGSSIKSHKGNHELLTQTRKQVIQLKHRNTNEEIAISEIIKGLNNFFRLRSKRISFMEIGLSPYILMALGFMSFSILYVVFTEPPGEFVVIDTVVFILSILQSFMIMMLIDINNPFEGYWSIKVGAFNKIKELIKEEIILNEK